MYIYYSDKNIKMCKYIYRLSSLLVMFPPSRKSSHCYPVKELLKSLRPRSNAKGSVKFVPAHPKQNESFSHFGLPLHFAHAAIIIIDMSQLHHYYLFSVCLPYQDMSSLRAETVLFIFISPEITQYLAHNRY